MHNKEVGGLWDNAPEVISMHKIIKASTSHVEHTYGRDKNHHHHMTLMEAALVSLQIFIWSKASNLLFSKL